nr:hypothetical protein [Paludisphaera mucosa]
MGTAESIAIRHPASMPEKKARSAWKRYLTARASTHLFWLIVDGILAPVTGLALWLLPGPNVVGFWFTYRAINHYTIVRAIRRARWRPPPTTFEADEALDEPVREAEDDAPAHDAVEDAANLRLYIERRKASDDVDAHPHDDQDDPAGTDVQPSGKA